MIKVEFTYRTAKKNLPELMAKFNESANNKKFISDVTNLKLELSQREKHDEIFIVLGIYYATLADYETRTKFERSIPEWNKIWFSKTNLHELESVYVYQVMELKQE